MADRRMAHSPVLAGLGAALPPATASLTVRVIDGMRVLALRHLAGGAAALEQALLARGLPPLPQPGTCHGRESWLAWVGPSETVLLTPHHAVADSVLLALAPGQEQLVCALDQSTGCLVFELCGPGIADVLPRLLDASAIPDCVGRAGRARWMDISAVVLRTAHDSVWLVFDQAHAAYAASWLTRIHQAAAWPGALPAASPSGLDVALR